MTPFERALRERIAREGAISVETYMEACNAYYYATRDPLGAGGDFTTAPEISQMFGEIIGATLADCWRRAGSPSDAVYVELGPGRGTLASDALRVMRSASFTGDVHFIETSPVLRKAQGEAVPEATWHNDLSSLPDAPLLTVANEFFDALPVRQFVNGVERKVCVAAGGLSFDRDGDIIEESPVGVEVARTLANHLVKYGGVALVIDYGHAQSAPGDTLQAVRGHRFAPILANPGEQDLTSHVDFETLATAAMSAGAEVTPIVTQGNWLRVLGIDPRADALATSNPDRAEEIHGARDRLVNEDQMGRLFKVMALHSAGWSAPEGFQ